METIRKIDFFGGLHGNYLELVVNRWIDRNTAYDITLPQFNLNGACHLKNKNENYVPITTARHYSWYNLKFRPDDLVIRIVVNRDDLLIAVTNSFLRAGDDSLDLEHLEFDTYNKMIALPKLSEFLATLTNNHGLRDEYPRGVLRKYFYAIFDENKHGLDMFNRFIPANNVYNFNFRNFFSFSDFLQGLQEVSKFVNLEFVPDWDLTNLHGKFLQVNQGYFSELKCKRAMEMIIQKQSASLNLNIVEEAWVNYKISRTFNLYNVPELDDDIYPTDTEIISKICFNKGTMC